MKKKFRALFLLFLAVTFVCSCAPSPSTHTSTAATSAPPKEPTPFPDDYDINPVVGNMKSILESHINPPLEALSEIDYEYYRRLAIPRGTHPQQNIDLVSFTEYEGWLDVEYVSMLDDNHIYIIYKLVRDDGKSVYMYRTFVRVLSANGEYEGWRHANTCEVYYLTNSLSHAEFTNKFSIGDTMEQAILVSPGLEFDLDGRYDYPKPFYHPPGGRPEIPTQTCYQLLKDGVLILRFEANCTTDEWEAQGKPNSALICTDMEFYPNGTAATVDGVELTVLTAPASKRPPLPKGTD